MLYLSLYFHLVAKLSLSTMCRISNMNISGPPPLWEYSLQLVPPLTSQAPKPRYLKGQLGQFGISSHHIELLQVEGRMEGDFMGQNFWNELELKLELKL